MQDSDQRGGGRGLMAGRGEALRARRGAAVAVITPPASDEGDRVGKRNRVGKQKRSQDILTSLDADKHRKALNHVMRILSETPADATGKVEGTTFTKAGVKALIDMLTKRSADPEAGGAKMAGSFLKRLTAVGTRTEGERVHGVLVSLLQKLGRTTDALRSRAKGKSL